MAKKAHSIRLYLLVYVALLCLLGLTVGASYLNIGRYPNNIIAIGIACIKTLLIILIFMHMKYERWITWIFAAAGMVWLCIMMCLMMTDYLSRNHPANSSPKGEPVFVSER
jgi:cytochrome c oxidase subunit IV